MSYLIIGCGYLGRRVAARWLAQGGQVYAVTRHLHRAEELRQQGITPLVGDVLTPTSLAALPAVDVVLYSVGFDRQAGPSMRDVYVTGLGNVLHALPRPQQLVYISSTGVYGQCQGEDVTEGAATEPIEESGQIVLEAENRLRQQLPEAVILRFSGIYGPGRLIRSQALLAGEPILGDADKWLNLIHVEDGVTAVLAAVAHAPPGRIYNISDDAPTRRRDFYTYLAPLLNAPPPRFEPLPASAPLPSHERTNRRILNQRMHEELGVTLRYPSYRDGLPAALTVTGS
ncbi:MAG: SDR family oxidoreductase [Gemmataceae bacterium]